jgi:hypothetical protein
MKMNKTIVRFEILIVLIVTCMIFTLNIFGQSKAGTTIGQFLKIGPSARISALADAGASLSGEASLAFYNAGSLGRLDKMEFQFSHVQWLANIDYNYAIFAVPVQGIGNISLHLISLNSGEMDVRTVNNPEGTGERFTVSNTSIGLGYSVMLTNRVSVGFQTSYLSETIWNSSYSNFALSMGVLYQVADNSLQIGASVANFGPRAGYSGRDLYIDFDFDPDKYGDNDGLPAELRTDEYSLPTIFRVGVSYPFVISEDYLATISIDAIHPNDNVESVNTGVELKLLDYVNLRGGYRGLFLEDSEGGLVLGAGINAELISYFFKFDYAWADYGRLENVHRFTIGISL